MSNQVLTAPIALIKVDGIVVGYMKTLRVNTNWRRGRVSGIGEVIAKEVPILEFNGTLSCEFYSIKYDTGLPKAMLRKAPSIEAFIDNILMQEKGIDLVIFKTVKDVLTADGLIKSKPKVFAQIKRLFLDREGLTLNEGAISGKNQEFTFLSPIIYSV